MTIPNTTHNVPKLLILKFSKSFMLFMPIIVLFYQDNGLTLAQIMLMQSLYSIAIVVFEVPSGYYADRVNRKSSLTIGTMLNLIGCVILSISHNFLGFLTGLFIGGIGTSFISGTDSALLYDSLLANDKEDEYVKWQGRIYSLGNFSEAIAAVIGGGLASLMGLRSPIIGQIAIASLGVLAAITLVEPPTKERQIKHVNGIRHFLEFMRSIFIVNAALRWSVLLSAISGSSALILAWFAQPYLKNLGLDEFWVGIIWGALNLTVALVSLESHRIYKTLGHKRTIALIPILIMIGHMLLGSISHISIYIGIPALFMLYVVRGVSGPTLKNLINQLTTSEMRATVLSARSLLIRIFYAISSPFLGWVADIYTLSQAFILSGILFGTFGILSMMMFRSKAQSISLQR